MQFQVPQFIETEDKIVGPLTLKQFLYLAAAGVISFMSFFVLKTFLWVIITATLGLIAAAFAFVKYNGQTLIKVMMSAFQYAWNPKMYLWQKASPKTAAVPSLKIPVIKEAKEKRPLLKDLLLKLTTSMQAAPKKPAEEQMEKIKYETWRKLTGEKEIARRIDYR